MALSFAFDPQKGETAETLAKRRRVAEALLARAAGQAPRNVGEGLSALGNALAYRFAMNGIDKAEKAGKATADSAMSRVARALFNGPETFPEAPSRDRVADAIMNRGKKAEGEVDTSLAVVPEDYYAAAERAESGGNRFAKNPNSSATGPFQFITSTWQNLAKRRPDLGLTPDGRTDPEQANRAMRAFTEENAAALQSAGIPIDGGSLYAAHFLGSGGAKNVLTADPNASVASIVGQKVVNANPFLANMSVGQFKQWAARKGGGGNRGQGTQVASLDPSAGLPAFDPYSNIPAVDGMGQDQRAKFRAWNSDPAGNEAANMAGIDPALRGVIERARQISGQNFVLGSGRRSPEQQKVAIANGWSGTMDSDHIGGAAADLWPVDENGAVIFDPQRQQQIVAAMKQAAGELGVDMEAGADWRRKDMPHFGMTNQTPLDNAPVPTPRPGSDQTAGLFLGTPEEMAAQRQQRVPPQMLDPRAMGPQNGFVPQHRGQEPPQTVRAPSAGNPANQPGPMRMADANQMSDADALAAFGAQPYDANRERMQAIMAAYRNGFLGEQDRSLVDTLMQRELDAQDPYKKALLEKAQLDLEKARRDDGEFEFKVVGDRLLKIYRDGRPPEDATPQEAAAAGASDMFDGKSVEAQGLNYLVRTNRLTPEQAAQLAAGKQITDPSTGAIMFMTPEGIFGQQPGQQPQPVMPQGGSQLLSPMLLGDTGQMQPRPQQAPAPQPSSDRPGAIPLTPPKAAKEPTDGERNAMTFADRMRQSGSVIDQSGDTATGVWSNAVTNNAYIPDILENMLVSSDFQKYDQARRDFVNAVLRRESGAVISAEEFENANRQYFPQPGDSQDVIEQKKRNRQTVIDGMTRAGGKTYQPGSPPSGGSSMKSKYGLD
jgi:hypothetical protein